MAKKKKHKPPTTPSPAPPAAPAPALPRASLPAELPRPDLTLWLLGGVMGVMISRLIHEMAHWAVLRFGGVKGVHLLPTAVRFDGQESFWEQIASNHFPGAALVASPSVVGWSELAGPLVSVALTWAAARLVRHADLQPWAAGLAAGAPLRLLAPALFTGLVVLRYFQGRPPHRQMGLDEYSAELLLGIPAAFLLLVEVVLTVPALKVVWDGCELAQRRVHAIALAAGLCFGLGLLVWLG